MVSFASADAERRVRCAPGQTALTASPRAEPTAAVDSALVAARRRPAAAHVPDGAGGVLQADEKAWCSSLRVVGWLSACRSRCWCGGFGVKTCALLPRRIVFFGRRNGAIGKDSALRRDSEGFGRERPSARRLRGPVLYEVGFGEPYAAELTTPRREARSRSSQSQLCSTFRPPFTCRPKTDRGRSQAFYQQRTHVSSAKRSACRTSAARTTVTCRGLGAQRPPFHGSCDAGYAGTWQISARAFRS
jgi:hypothetical protein